MAKSTKGTRRMGEVSKELKCLLTDKEKIERGYELAELDKTERKIEAELNSFKAHHENRIAKIHTRRNVLVEAVAEGYEWRAVVCEILHDVAERKVLVIRKDTGEIAQSRAMNSDELQANFLDQEES